MAAGRHFYSSTSVGTALSAAITNVAGIMSVPESASDNGWPTSFPFTLAIDYGGLIMELVDVVAKSTLTSGNRSWIIQRNVDSTLAVAHSAGAVVRHVLIGPDVVDARRGDSVQPDLAVPSFVKVETVAGASFTDSLVGDLIVKGNGRILIGTDSPSGVRASYAQVVYGPGLTQGVPAGGAAGAVLTKASSTDYDTSWKLLPMVDASASASVNTTAGTFLPLTFATTDASRGSGLTRGSTQVTVAVTGRYAFMGYATWAGNALGRRILGIALNGATPVPPYEDAITPNSAGGLYHMFYTEIELTASDAVGLSAYQDSGSTLAITNRRIIVRQLY